MGKHERKRSGRCCGHHGGRACPFEGVGSDRGGDPALPPQTLAQLPVGATARVLRVVPAFRGCRKFADVGIVPGTELLMEAHAPFGGLLRVRVLDSSMSLHRDDAVHVEVKGLDNEEDV